MGVGVVGHETDILLMEYVTWQNLQYVAIGRPTIEKIAIHVMENVQRKMPKHPTKYCKGSIQF